ncbi:RNA polymerase sigma factor [Thalassotalea euphylliae]|uniref:RNA polymerase sigma factor n=1 Tax=Thalassotalea euphylliae TaxID=1655234 RepID=UPI003642FC52
MAEKSLINKVFIASRNSISRLVSRIVPPDEIEDIVQETYVRICQVEHGDKITSPKSFMLKTAHNLAIDYHRKASVRLVDDVGDMHQLEYLLSDKDEDQAYKQAVTNSEFGEFCEAVRQLPVQCRKVFVLKKVYGYSQKEIAKELGLSESTVEKHVASGIKRCMQIMNKVPVKKASKTSASTIASAGGKR